MQEMTKAHVSKRSRRKEVGIRRPKEVKEVQKSMCVKRKILLDFTAALRLLTRKNDLP